MSNLVNNPKAHYDYELLEKLEAGLELSGFEVKALKLGRGKLEGGRVLVRGGEAFLVGAEISPYQAANLPPDYEKGRALKLLLTKKEISDLAARIGERGLTIIPLSVYNKGGRLKLGLALARGKKKYDKREKIKKRENKRDLDRTLKSRF
ncbi:SsrA-binding protein SmpB [Candidatus Nomurabacteria bacterium]|nr:SsrA-binding protein SmpB [Candidatus Nomurabacteria bacterium]